MSTGLIKFAMAPLISNRLSILIYHRVHDENETRFMEPTATEFDSQVRFLKRFFNFFTLEDAAQRLRSRTLPPRSAVITFDDGYRDNFTNALPILLKHKIPASFYVSTSFINSGAMWNDKILYSILNSNIDAFNHPELKIHDYLIGSIQQKKGLAADLINKLKHLDYVQRSDLVEEVVKTAGGKVPDNLMMTSDQVKGLSEAGMEIGGHTSTHPILTSLSDKDAVADILNGKALIESWLGKKIRTFAYPNGKPGADYSRAHVDAVKNAGFEFAVSTAWGVSTPSSDPFQLPRFRPWDKGLFKFYLRMLLNYQNENGKFVD